jgi:hypothetical protein
MRLGTRLSLAGGTAFAVATILATALCARAQKLEPLPLEKLPQSGTFWSLQRTNFPPWPLFPPFLREAGAPVYLLDAQRGIFLVDDTAVDYQAGRDLQ